MKYTKMIVVMAMAMVMSVALCQSPVLLRDIQTLTFNLGELSTGRREPPRPKLTCEYSPNPSLNPTSFQCYNRGINDMGNVQWECKPSNLDPSLKIFKTNVNCEGYNYPDDPYVLAGSCVLTYSLMLSQTQQQQQQQQYQQQQYQQQQYQQQNNNGNYYSGGQQRHYRGEVPDTKNYYKSYHPTKSHPAMSHFLKTVIFCCLAGFTFLFVTKFLSTLGERRRRRDGNDGGDDGNGRRRRNSGNFNDDDHFGHGGGGGGGGNNDNGGSGGNGGCCYQQRGSGGSFMPSVGTIGLAAAGLYALERRREEQNRMRYEQQQQFQNYQQQQQQQQQQHQQFQAYGQQQQVPPRDEPRSYADTSRR